MKSNPGNYEEHVIDLAKRLRQVSEAVSQEKREMDESIQREIMIYGHRLEKVQ